MLECKPSCAMTRGLPQTPQSMEALPLSVWNHLHLAPVGQSPLSAQGENTSGVLRGFWQKNTKEPALMEMVPVLKGSRLLSFLFSYRALWFQAS
jgi:hypothetical protein